MNRRRCALCSLHCQVNVRTNGKINENQMFRYKIVSVHLLGCTDRRTYHKKFYAMEIYEWISFLVLTAFAVFVQYAWIFQPNRVNKKKLCLFCVRKFLHCYIEGTATCSNGPQTNWQHDCSSLQGNPHAKLVLLGSWTTRPSNDGESNQNLHRRNWIGFFNCFALHKILCRPAPECFISSNCIQHTEFSGKCDCCLVDSIPKAS